MTNTTTTTNTEHTRYMPPARGKTTRSQADIDRAVKRHLEGREPVSSLCREYRISRAGFYLWVRKYKNDVLERGKRQGMKPADADRSHKADLIAEIEALRLENRKLRDRLVAEMMRHAID